MKKFNTKLLFLFLISILVFVAGCTDSEEASSETTDKGSSQVSGEKILKVGLTGSPGNIDPHFAGNHVEFEVVQPVFNGLLRFEPGTATLDTIEGDLAETWDVSEDGLVWTFKLREGVQWHKGYGELTSADVKYSLERIMDPEVGSNQRSQLKYVDKVVTPDDYTVEIHLTQPYPSLPVALTVDGMASGAIVKKEAIESEGDIVDQLVGTGPFELESYVPGEKAILKKNPDYFRGEPKLDGIEFTVMRDLTAREVALTNGDIHMTRGELDKVWLDRMKENEDLIFSNTPTPNVAFLHMNVEMEPMDNILVRKAIAHAIDFENLRTTMYADDYSYPLSSLLADDIYGNVDIGRVEYDPELAKKYLAEAGYADGLTLPKVLSPNLSSYTSVNSFIQEQLRQVGVELPVEQVDLPTWMLSMYGQENIVAYQIGVQRTHGVINLQRNWHSEGNANFAAYSAADDLIDAAEQEMDEEKFFELSEQIQKQVIDDYASIPLFAVDQINVWRKEVDLGYELKGTGVYAAPKYETTDLKVE